MSVFFDLVRVYCTTVGTGGPLALGGAVTFSYGAKAFRSFADAGIPDGAALSWAIEDLGVPGREAGTGTYSAAGGTLTRNTTSSTNGNNPLALSGQAQLYVTALAADLSALAAGGNNGQVQYNNAGGFGGFTVGGDGALNTSTGALTVAKTNGVAFAPSATTDTTNASNISGGTLPLARFGSISASQFLGGPFSGSGVPSWRFISTADLPTISGDVSIPGGTGVATLAASGVTSGSYTSANITVDAKGRVTAASNGSGVGGGGRSPGGSNGQLQYNNSGGFGGFTVAGDGALTASTGVLTLFQRNKFRNATMDVVQRGTSGSVAAGTTAYTADGWQVVATGAATAWSRVYGANLPGNAFRLSCASGLTACTFKQRIESYVAAQLLNPNNTAQAVTVQFTIYNNTGASFTPQIAAGYASAQDNFGTVTSDLAATNLQSCANGAVTTVAYTFTPSASLANGYEIQLEFGGALNAASGYVDISFADSRATPGLATGLNSTPPAPETRPIHQELLFCYRYFWSTYGNGQGSPGSAQHLGAIGGFGGAISYKFPVEMRAAGTFQFWDTAGNANKLGSMSQSGGALAYGSNTSPTDATSYATGTMGFQFFPASASSSFFIYHAVISAEF